MNENVTRLQNHPIVTQEQEIKNLCKPLELLNISTFTHLRIDSEQKLTGLSNHPKCWLNYIEKNYSAADPQVLIKPETFDVGQYLAWDAIQCRGKALEMFTENAINFDFKHVFTIIKKKILQLIIITLERILAIRVYTLPT